MNERATKIGNEEAAGDWLAKAAKSHANLGGALIVGLSGHLGAGKTAFVKTIGRILGVRETVTSPTFVIMKRYDIGNSGLEVRDSGRSIRIPWKKLVHVDAYRLENPGDLEVLGWEDLASDCGNLIMVEWPENVGLDRLGETAGLRFEIRDGVYTIQ